MECLKRGVRSSTRGDMIGRLNNSETLPPDNLFVPATLSIVRIIFGTALRLFWMFRRTALSALRQSRRNMATVTSSQTPMEDTIRRKVWLNIDRGAWWMSRYLSSVFVSLVSLAKLDLTIDQRTTITNVFRSPQRLTSARSSQGDGRQYI